MPGRVAIHIGQGLRPTKGRTWGRRGRTPVVRVTARNSPRLSLVALIALPPHAISRTLCQVLPFFPLRFWVQSAPLRHQANEFVQAILCRLVTVIRRV